MQKAQGGRMQGKVKSRVVVCALSAWLVAGAGVVRQLYAQGATGSISGTVTDASGAAMADTVIQVINAGTGIAQSTNSDGQGRFRVSDLAIGEYEVQATKPGFQVVVHKGITLTVGAQPVVDFTLPVGTAQQTITV